MNPPPIGPSAVPGRAARRRPVVAVLALAGIAGLAIAATAMRTDLSPAGDPPPEGWAALRAASDHATSSACVPCHPDHHASWARTHHAAMTRDPLPENIAAPFDGRPLTFLGTTTVPTREGDRFFLETRHPVTGSRAKLAVARVTGSRRMQQYHARIGDRFVRLPVAWSIAEQRWFHLDEAFFEGPGAGFNDLATAWDMNCIFCHTVKADPGLAADGSLASRSAELGIACESCHGAAEEHARRMRSPLRRMLFHLTPDADPTLVNPGTLPQERSVQVCGHCHGQRVPSDVERAEDIFRSGDPYVPGEDLSLTWSPIFRDTTVMDLNFAPRFWPDGSPRLTAYEYQGLLRSPCYRDGDMTCVSCHSMHAGDPAGQIRPDLTPDQLCGQCHASVAERAAEHAGHPADSSGARCVACHMPPVVYGVMSWHPTHEVSSPDPARGLAHDTPDACTTCHVGRTPAWADRETRRLWPGAPREEAGPDARRDEPAMARALFAGDAVRRTHAAWRLGEPDPPERAVRALAIPLLAEALLDTHASVRRAAAMSLRNLTGRTDIPNAHDAMESRDRMRRELQATPVAGQLDAWPVKDGSLDREVITRWTESREELPFHVGE